jgi:ABC-type dipeptide/oligopeptide/nickel transport system permease component
MNEMNPTELIQQMWALSAPMLLVTLLLSVACAVVCGYIAHRRKARWVYWSAMGFAFGPFALLFVFLAKPKPPATGDH